MTILPHCMKKKQQKPLAKTLSTFISQVTGQFPSTSLMFPKRQEAKAKMQKLWVCKNAPIEICMLNKDLYNFHWKITLKDLPNKKKKQN